MTFSILLDQILSEAYSARKTVNIVTKSGNSEHGIVEAIEQGSYVQLRTNDGGQAIYIDLADVSVFKIKK